MTDRERWIVYPLLFLALGAGLRDKLAKQTRAKQIVCEHLYLVDSEGRPSALLTGDELRFDLGSGGNGFVKADTIHAQAIFEQGRPVIGRGAQGQSMSLQQLLQLLPQMRAAPAVPGAPVAPPAVEAPESLPPEGDASPAETPAEPETPANEAPVRPASEPPPAA